MFKFFFSFFSQFLECEAKICKFLVNFVIFYIFVTPFLQEINILVREKILKNKDVHNASLACIIESVPKKFDTFLWNLGLDP